MSQLHASGSIAEARTLNSIVLDFITDRLNLGMSFTQIQEAAITLHNWDLTPGAFNTIGDHLIKVAQTSIEGNVTLVITTLNQANNLTPKVFSLITELIPVPTAYHDLPSLPHLGTTSSEIELPVHQHTIVSFLSDYWVPLVILGSTTVILGFVFYKWYQNNLNTTEITFTNTVGDSHTPLYNPYEFEYTYLFVAFEMLVFLSVIFGFYNYARVMPGLNYFCYAIYLIIKKKVFIIKIKLQLIL
jgi:hypothetical protein